MQRNLYILLITAICLATTPAGCIRQDQSDCHEVFLAFECINPDYHFPEIAKELELLFYDPKGELAYDLSYTSSQLAANNWKVNLTNDIPQPGTYTVVALVNYHTGTPLSLNAKTEKETFLAEIKYNNQRWVDYTVTDSYHGTCNLDFKRNNDRPVQHTMPLSKHTNTIKLTIEFTNREAVTHLTGYSSYLAGENARYKWNYTIPPHPPGLLPTLQHHLAKRRNHPRRPPQNHAPTRRRQPQTPPPV
ncbi:MAG: FimB/Mfa2 family fimbrial subunit [Bacteroides sp.]|nr:FimB/Mfa2 family fimbrial subunit [Bacteroides sp.]MCD8265438.1 FimB/Mfa2 family fimbrial subunit [Tannerellaceae bacterium]